MGSQDTVGSLLAGNTYFYAVTHNPSLVPTFAYAGTIAIGVGNNPLVKGKMWQKQDDGLTANWVFNGAGNVSSVNGQVGIVDLKTDDIPNESLVAGASTTDALNTLLAGGGGSTKPWLWYDLKPADGKVLPVSQPRAYYPTVLYSAIPLYKDPLGVLRKYVAYYGAAASGQGYAAFSDDGITWDNETLVTGVTGTGYHASAILVGGIVHLFYWQGALIYTPASIRHATFNPAVSCVAAVSDNPLSGTYITGLVADGLRYGTYGPDQLYYNAAPTSNPANPYTYQWCMIHSGVGTGTNEGILFATSADGLNFSAWGGLNEVVPRGTGAAWDLCIGNLTTFIDTNGLWHGFYAGGVGTPTEDSNFAGGLGYVTSIDGITWTKYWLNPIIRKTESMKSWKRLYTPWILKDASGYKLYFACKNNAGAYVTSYAVINGWI